MVDEAPGTEKPTRNSLITSSLRFDHYMDASLYGSHGFYARGHGAGTQRDFLTSPEVGTLFGAVLARRMDTEWDRLGQPSTFTVVEVGAGPGTLARTVFAAQPRCVDTLQYVLVDRAEGMRALHHEHLPAGHVQSLEELPSAPIVGMVIANELLDNIPTRVVQFDENSGQWIEKFVNTDEGKRQADWRRCEEQPPFDHLVQPVRPPWPIPLQRQAGELALRLLQLVQHGSLILIDYMRHTTAEFPPTEGEWMRTYRLHQRGIDPLAQPGDCDITVDVAADQLIAAVGTPTVWQPQSEALVAWGLTDVLSHSASTWATRTSDFDLDALRARSHSSEAPILTDPAGLGGFTVMEWMK
jgi:SAM-dependent MidA family methyltransferase